MDNNNTEITENAYSKDVAKTSNDFLSFLDEQFEQNRPFESGPLIDIGEDYRTTSSYWHEVIRDHKTSKPAFPRTASIGNRRLNLNSFSRKSTDNLNCSGILNANRHTKVQHIHCNRLLGSEDMGTVVKQGWTIAKVCFNNNCTECFCLIALNYVNRDGKIGQSYLKSTLQP